MPKEFARTQRVARQVSRSLAKILHFEFSELRTKMISIPQVTVSRDLAYAKVYFNCLGSEQDIKQVAQLLNNKSGHLRYLLAQAMTLRYTPELTFIHNGSLIQAEKINNLIDLAIASHDAMSQE